MRFVNKLNEIIIPGGLANTIIGQMRICTIIITITMCVGVSENPWGIP